ncbi:MAG: DUF166 family protein [Planctomycetota bacterium]|jgi:hypothetical protein
MKILILRSKRHVQGESPRGDYTQEFSGSFANKVIGSLTGRDDFCTSCAAKCKACRRAYDRRFGPSIAGIIDLPAVLPYLLETPARHVPRRMPRHDILLAINIHEQVLMEILPRIAGRGARGVVVPIEESDWLSGSGRASAVDICSAGGVEISFPKPFCGFDPPAGSVLDEFRRRFHVGKPDVELTVRNSTITDTYVHVSAACGATYYVARGLHDKKITEDLKYGVVAKRLHSYPCTAGMKWDDEVGDTLMHVSCRAHYEILSPFGVVASAEGGGMVRAPSGRMIARPASSTESIRNIELAEQTILEELADSPVVLLDDLRKKGKVTPAAIYSAMLILERAGKIRIEADKIIKL